MLGCAAHREKQPSKRRVLSWKKGTNDTKHSYGCNRHAHNTAQHSTEQCWELNVSESSFKMEIERDNYLNLCLVGGYERSICVVFTRPLRFSIAALLLLLLLLLIVAALLLDLFSCRSLLFPIICNYAALYEWDCVYARTHIFVLVSMPRHKPNQTKPNNKTNKKNKTTTLCLYTHTAYACYIFLLICSFTSHTVWAQFNSYFDSLISSITSSDWSIQAWDLTAQ